VHTTDISSLRGLAAALVPLAVLLGACGGDDAGPTTEAETPDTELADDAETGETSDGSGTEGNGATGEDVCHIAVELSGDVNESIDTTLPLGECGGSAVTALTLAWPVDEVELLLRQIPLELGTTGTGLSGQLNINVGPSTSYGATCSIDISTNEPGDLPSTYRVEGSATCDDATEIGGDGVISVAGLDFTGYAIG
jgi:hypothetical protein